MISHLIATSTPRTGVEDKTGLLEGIGERDFQTGIGDDHAGQGGSVLMDRVDLAD